MQRTDQREQTADAVAEREPGDDAVSTDRRSSGGVRGRLGRLFSLRAFLLALVLSLVGLFLGGAVPVVGFVGRYVGLFAAAFVVGLVAQRRRYLEVGLAGGLASGLGFVLSAVTSAFLPFAVSLLAEYGLAVAGVGAGVGLLVSLAGHYFGRDLRDGLTREV
jgi:hypothetical protein